MPQIPLSRGLYAEVSPEWYQYLSQFKWFARYSKSNNAFYASRNVGKRPHRTLEHMHRVIMSTPEGLDVDHINGDTLDNRVENLRNCHRSMNVANSKLRTDNTSGFRGVHMTRSGRWCALVRSMGITIFQKNYESKIESAVAYDKAARLAFGEYATLNFPDMETT